jgi:HemY protein
MRGVIWLVLLFVVAVVAATTLGPNDGLVSLYWGGWRTDLSLNLFVILVLGACALLVLGAQAVQSLLSLPQRAGAWRALRRERAAESALREALAEYFGARYGRATKAAQRALVLQPDAGELAGDARFRTLAQLLAAGSAHRLQDRKRREAVLAQAEQDARGNPEEAVRLLAAEWALEDRDAVRALEQLDALAPGAARRTQALRLRLQALRQQRQPLEALRTARLLANHQAFSPAVAQGLLRSLASEALESAHDAAQLRRIWGQFDAADRRDAMVGCRAAQRAALLQAHEDGRQWLRPFWERLAELPRDERDAVALALIEVRQGLGTDWLPRLEAAAQTWGQEPAILAAVGMAFAERRLWGKARALLEQAGASPQLPARARRACWRERAALALQEGDESTVARCQRAAAELD